MLASRETDGHHLHGHANRKEQLLVVHLWGKIKNEPLPFRFVWQCLDKGSVT